MSAANMYPAMAKCLQHVLPPTCQLMHLQACQQKLSSLRFGWLPHQWGFSRPHNQSKVSEWSVPCGVDLQPDMESSPIQLFKPGTSPFSKPNAVCEAAWLTPTCRTYGSQPPLYSSSLPSYGLPSPTKSSIPAAPTPAPQSHNAGPAYPSPTSTNKVNAMT